MERGSLEIGSSSDTAEGKGSNTGHGSQEVSTGRGHDGARTEPAASPSPSTFAPVGARTLGPPKGKSPAEARMRAARAGVVVAQGEGPDPVTCLQGRAGHVTGARVS